MLNSFMFCFFFLCFCVFFAKPFQKVIVLNSFLGVNFRHFFQETN